MTGEDTPAEILRAAAEIARLRQIIAQTPILVIDRAAALLLGEDVALKYARDVAAWYPEAKAAIAITITEGPIQ